MARKRETCRDCERHTSECGPLSRRGKCTDCAARNMAESARQIECKEGPYYEKYRREVIAAGLTIGDRL